MAAESFRNVDIPQQKKFSGIQFPLVLSPSSSNPDALGHHLPITCISSFTAAVRSNRAWLSNQLSEVGAILFRGFPVNSASDFNDDVEAFGFDEFPYIGGAAPRSHVVGRVFSANDSPPDQKKIPFHHELAQLPEFPLKLFFYCEVAPTSGGETPIVLSHIIYEKMKERHPRFVQDLEETGLIYTRVLGGDDDPSSPIGRGWKSTFSTEDKFVAEEMATKLGTKLEWLEDGGVKMIMGPIQAIKVDNKRNKKVWFNNLVAAYTGWKDSRNDLGKTITFGDGKLLPSDAVDDCLRILEDECVAFPWRKGDFLLIDNCTVLHSRGSYDPPRQVLASLCK